MSWFIYKEVLLAGHYLCTPSLPGMGISEEKCLFSRQINNEERGVGRLVGKKISYSIKFCEFDLCEYPSIRK